MLRKIVKQGNNAATVTLPSNWIKKNNLEFGDFVEFNNLDENLILSSKKKIKNKEISLNLIKKTRPELFQIILAKYIQGFTKIEIKHQDSKTIEDIEKELTGFLLSEHSKEKSTFELISNENDIEIENLLIKVTFYLKRQIELLKELSENKVNLEEFLFQEKIMDKTILYTMRLLNFNYKNNLKEILICQNFDLIGDSLSEIAQNYKSSRENKELIQTLSKHLNIYTEKILSKKSSELILNLREFRNNIPKNSFLSGISYSLADNLYNFIGLLVENKK